MFAGETCSFADIQNGSATAAIDVSDEDAWLDQERLILLQNFERRRRNTVSSSPIPYREKHSPRQRSRSRSPNARRTPVVAFRESRQINELAEVLRKSADERAYNPAESTSTESDEAIDESREKSVVKINLVQPTAREKLTNSPQK